MITTARAQQHERRIGMLMGYAESDSEGRAFAAAFREELSNKFGWAEGRNIRIDTRWAAPKRWSTRNYQEYAFIKDFCYKVKLYLFPLSQQTAFVSGRT